MGTEELMRPRYKVISDYPFNEYFVVGEIITEKEDGEFVALGVGNHPRRFPSIFKRLEWYEERSIEDMPQYIKIKDKVFKVDKWKNGVWTLSPSTIDENGNELVGIDFYFQKDISEPATEAQYQEYLKNK